MRFYPGPFTLVIDPHYFRRAQPYNHGGQMEQTKDKQYTIPSTGYAFSHDDLIKALREIFPHGHSDYLPIAVGQLKLHSEKNHDYAAGGSPMGNFDRVSSILALYPGLNLSDRRVVALVYALKQLDAVLWGLAKRIVHKVEGLNERLGDIAVYANLVQCMNTEDARNLAIDRQFGVDLAKTGQDTKAYAAGGCTSGGSSPLRGAFANVNEIRKAPEGDREVSRVELSTKGLRDLSARDEAERCAEERRPR